MERRILFLGQKPIGEKCFEYLLSPDKVGFRLIAVSSNTTTDTWWKTARIAYYAKHIGIHFVDNASPNDSEILSLCESKGINTIISVQHPHLLSLDVIKAVQMEAYNLHLAPLPEYKGYNGHSFAILNGDTEYGVTLHKMEPRADSGDIVEKKMFDIEPDDTALSLYKKSEYWAEEVFRRFLGKLKTGEAITAVPQQGVGEYHGHRSLDAFRRLGVHCDKDFSYGQISRVSRAMWFPPFEPAYFQVNGKKYYVIPEWPIS